MYYFYTKEIEKFHNDIKDALINAENTIKNQIYNHKNEI